MMLLAAWSVAMALLLWLGKTDKALWAWAGSAVGALTGAPLWATIATGLMSGLLWMQSRESRRPDPQLRESLIRFWQEVRVLLAAGVNFWQAVEYATQEEPPVAPLISRVAGQITESPHVLPANPGFPGPDGDVTLVMLQHGYLHGLRPEQVEAEVRHMESRLGYEREAKKRRDPLWMTVLPAMLLLNVLALFVTPMLAMATHSWLKV